MKAWLMPLAMAAALVGAGLVLRRSGFDLASVLPDRGARGACVFVALGAAVLLLGLPRQAVAFAGGTAFGVAAGGALAWIAAMISCVLAYGLARGAWRRPARIPEFLARARRGLADKPFLATLSLRLLPVGHNLALTLFCGAVRVRPAPFLAGSALGYVPQTLIFALLGGGAALGQGEVLAAGTALLLASILGGFVLRSAAV